MRFVLFGALLVAGTLSLFNLVRNRRRNLNALAFGLIAAAAWGGAGVPVGNFSEHTPFVGLHANVRLPWGPLRRVLVTQGFHHWHHSSDDEAIDKNYATQFAFLDRLFGTAVRSDRLFPQNYGVVGNYMPEGFVRQQLFPFQRLLAARAS
ncbi:MAG: hypothetical protein QOF15_3197 [Mycobacterium sp.]|nr:hypothetical protein [Mycobacterium sp.]